MGKPEIIGPQNERKHLSRYLEHRFEKETLRRNDRRKNFAIGETVGTLLVLGAMALVAALDGGVGRYEIEPWQRIAMGGMGMILLVAQHVMRRSFNHRTEAPLIGAQKKKEHVDDSRS